VLLTDTLHHIDAAARALEAAWQTRCPAPAATAPEPRSTPYSPAVAGTTSPAGEALRLELHPNGCLAGWASFWLTRLSCFHEEQQEG
jgi:hypothetical protein